MISRPHRLLSDERLARLTGDGNDAAFAVLHRRYDPLLHGYTRSIARDADDAADALQNAWIAALIALRADRRSAPVRPWLFRIAHNAAIDVLRRKCAAVRTLDRGFLLAVPGVDEQYDRSEAMAELVGDVRDLPTNQRAAIVMRELADLDYAEIAIALSTSEGNARQLVFAARDGLRESRAGRALPCESVRGVLSRADRRELRRRRLRAHLDSCPDCREYAENVARPTRKVAGWAPTPAVLQSIFAAAGGSGAAVAQGGSFAALTKGAVAATLVIAGVGTGEAVVHHRGAAGSEQAVAADSHGPGQAAGALVADAEAAGRAAPSVPAKVIRNASARATRSEPAVLRTRSRAGGRRSAAGVRRVARAQAGDGRTNTSQGSRRQPGSAEPADWSPGPHAGDRDAGSDGAGPRGYDGGPRPEARRPGGGGGSRPGGGGGDGDRFRSGAGARDCPTRDAGAGDAPPAE